MAEEELKKGVQFEGKEEVVGYLLSNYLTVI